MIAPKFEVDINEAGELSGIIVLANNNIPVVGKEIVLSYRTHGGTGIATSTDINLGTTDASGQVTVHGALTDKTPRVMEFSIDDYTTSTNITFGTVPAGFLTAVSASKMDLPEAKAFCLFHGGRLPLINDSNVYLWSTHVEEVETKNYATIDGFGRFYDLWPANVATDAWLWTDSEEPDMQMVWLLNIIYNKEPGIPYVSFALDFPDIKHKAICLP